MNTPNKNGPRRNEKPEAKIQLVESAGSRMRKTVEAYHIAEPVQQMIADEFRIVKSSRRLAKKYRIPRHVINDILHLCARKPGASEHRLIVMGRTA